MIIVGLTGSIAMGKTTTAAMFRGLGVPVHDADAVVHRLYRGSAAAEIGAAFPGTTRDGTVDRNRLATRVLSDPDALRRLEAIVHPLVRDTEQGFLKSAAARRSPLAVLDLPLLFETGGDRRTDAIIVVTADAAVQRQRVLARPGMTEEKFAAISARQWRDADKRRNAHFLVDTTHGLASAQEQVCDIQKALLVMAA